MEFVIPKIYGLTGWFVEEKKKQKDSERDWDYLLVCFLFYLWKSLNQITDNKTWSLDMWQVDRKFIYILFYFSSLAASEENWKIGGLETPPLMVND